MQLDVDVEFTFFLMGQHVRCMEFTTVLHFKELMCVGFIHLWNTFNKEPIENQIENIKYEG